jgi:hypothetical protein
MSFSVTGGIFKAVCIALVTIASRLGLDGAHAITNGITKILGHFGYSVSWVGLIMGILLGFIIGFLAFGLFVLIYNSMSPEK